MIHLAEFLTIAPLIDSFDDELRSWSGLRALRTPRGGREVSGSQSLHGRPLGAWQIRGKTIENHKKPRENGGKPQENHGKTMEKGRFSLW